MTHRRFLTRREVLAALGSAAAAIPLVPAMSRGVTRPSTTNDAGAQALLDEVADNLLRLFPEQATSLGIDTGPRATHRSQLADRSAAGQQRIAERLRTDLARLGSRVTDRLAMIRVHSQRCEPAELFARRSCPDRS